MTFPHPHSKLGPNLGSNARSLSSLLVSRVELEVVFQEPEPQELTEVASELLAQVNSCSLAHVKRISLRFICLSEWPFHFRKRRGARRLSRWMEN